MSNDDISFVLTEEHIKLLRQAHVTWDTYMRGAPCIDPKRPWGSKYLLESIAKVLGEDYAENDDGEPLDKAQEKRLMSLHRDMDNALQIVLATGSFEPGTYIRSESYRTDWRKVG